MKADQDSFYDVKETIHRIPVGGPTIAGQRLKDFLVYQTNLENQIPKVCASSFWPPYTVASKNFHQHTYTITS